MTMIITSDSGMKRFFFSCFENKIIYIYVAMLQLAREAVQTNSSVPHLVVGNQIITNVSYNEYEVTSSMK